MLHISGLPIAGKKRRSVSQACKMGTVYIALIQEGADLRIASAFIMPDRETQQFSGFSEIGH